MSSNENDPAPRKKSLYERLVALRVSLWSFWTDEAVMIYRRSAEGRDRARIIFVETFLFIREVVREFWRVQGTARAASLAFTTLLSLIPLLVAFSYAVRNWFARIFPDYRAQIDSFLNLILPYRSAEIAFHINRFLENAEAASTVGALVFLVIAFRLFMAVEAAINQIWKATTFRGYRQKIRAFTMLLFWGPILITLSFTTTAAFQGTPWLRFIVDNPIVAELIPFFILLIAFTMLFWLVPSTRVQFKSALFGGVITAILFELVREAFGLYAASVFTGRLNVIYGTLGLMVIFLFALELAWVIILLGVEVSYVFQNLQGVLRASEHQLEDDSRFDVYFALRAMVEIARRFDAREEAPSSYRLAEEFHATDRQMQQLLRRLESKQLVREIGGEWTGYTPACDPDSIMVEEVIHTIEGSSRAIPEVDLDQPERKAVARVIDSLQSCTASALGNVSIGRIVRELYGPRRPSRDEDVARFGR